MRFSERYKYKTARETIQVDSISPDLRISLWNLLKLHVWDHAHFSRIDNGTYLSSGNADLQLLCTRLWFDYFKRPLDTLNDEWSAVLVDLRKYFFDCPWYEAYDLIEFIASNFPYPRPEYFIEACNRVLEREVSAYRFVGGLITRVTDEVEIDAIDHALMGPQGPVRTHLRRALELLSDRASPDYRNSIKESISAVESLVGAVLGEKGTLGQLIKKLEQEIGLHPALRTAFSSLYGYTSDEDGIRHAIMESNIVGFDEAKFFLVVCSTFINFVESKVTLTKQS